MQVTFWRIYQQWQSRWQYTHTFTDTNNKDRHTRRLGFIVCFFFAFCRSTEKTERKLPIWCSCRYWLTGEWGPLIENNANGKTNSFGTRNICEGTSKVTHHSHHRHHFYTPGRCAQKDHCLEGTSLTFGTLYSWCSSMEVSSSQFNLLSLLFQERRWNLINSFVMRYTADVYGNVCMCVYFDGLQNFIELFPCFVWIEIGRYS